MNSWRKRLTATSMVLGLALGCGGMLHAQFPPSGYGPMPGGPGPQEPTPIASGLPQFPMPGPGAVGPYVPPGSPMVSFGGGPGPMGGPGGPGPMGGPGQMGPMGSPGPMDGPGGPMPDAGGADGPGKDKKMPPELTTSGSNAWQDTPWINKSGWYVSAGAQAYQNTGLPHKAVADLSTPVAVGVAGPFTTLVQVPVTFVAGNGQVVSATVPVSVTYTAPAFNGENGTPFLSGAQSIGDYQNLSNPYHLGMNAAVGLTGDDNSSVEFSGYYLPQSSSSMILNSPRFVPSAASIGIVSVGTIPNPGGAILSVGDIPTAVAAQLPSAAVGELNLPFFNAPPGFGGNNGLWTEADRVTINFQSTLGNAEANYRMATGGIFTPLFGLRYLDQSERLSIFTEDDAFSNPQPTTNATYTVHTHNRIIAGQLGMEINAPLLPNVVLNGSLKGAWGANVLSSDVSLVRGDGLVGFDGHRDTTVFSQIYEGGLYVDFYFLERGRIHAGYQVLWIPHMTRALDQVNYDLSQTTGTANDNGNIFYHGPVFELQFLF